MLAIWLIDFPLNTPNSQISPSPFIMDIAFESNSYEDATEIYSEHVAFNINQLSPQVLFFEAQLGYFDLSA
ncbi:hypothetical protein NK8_83270 (plasmid) [Caballeronia sp. NK8]|nr:hypothetical protein NK8_83270 [Caballeronia sp. NK8]